jgi:phenylalanyl-tRNA synthetase beta chain
MKISLNWVFDHIKGNPQTVAIADLVDRFIKTTAEIDGWDKVTLPVEKVTLVQAMSVANDAVRVMSCELNKEYVMPFRADVVVGLWYLIEYNCDDAVWAKITTFGGVKDALLPAVEVDEALRAGGWKSTIELHDYILDVDNKSINHRPDLWGHRGIAREIAAIFDLSFLPLDNFIVQKQSSDSMVSGKTGSFSVSIDSSVCKRFTALYIDTIKNRSSSLAMVIRLSRLDSRSINYLVDCTNYVMLDLGQPMHAFDADLLPAKKITVRHAWQGEKLLLLDGETLELTSHDVVIADGDVSVSLAGVMGGGATGINQKTSSVLLESAHFDATTIRRMAARHKKRSEASMRFEKSLDPHAAAHAIGRFLFLLDDACIAYNTDALCIQLGALSPIEPVRVAHELIENRLGVSVSVEKITSILEKLSFVVEPIMKDNEQWYEITPPSFRVTKDIKIAEDVIEEIGRYVGYDLIRPVMPAFNREPSDLHNTYTVRALKHLLSSGLLMRELYGYSFFDESFLRTISWKPTHCVDIKNPISENYTRLVTTLQPHLLKAVGENSTHHGSLRFYEWARVWSLEKDVMNEKKSLSGIFFERDKNFDFYDGKALLKQIFDEFHLSVTWKKPETTVFPWLSQHQTATLWHNDVCVGTAGMVEHCVVNELSVAGGIMFLFELDGDYLLNYKRSMVRFVPLPKYPSVRRDVSMMVPLSFTTDGIADVIKQSDMRIVAVTLLDFFTKPEWHDQKALTFHLEIRDNEKTLEHYEVEALWGSVIERLQTYGASIR